jgi:Cytochrome P460
MRWFATFSLLGFFAVLALAAEPVSELLPSAPADVNENRGWLRFIAARVKTMTRVTDKPLSMDLQVAMRCAPPGPDMLPEDNPHRGHYVHVYVTPGDEKKIRTGEGTYPVGTLIVKEKLPGMFAQYAKDPKAGTADKLPLQDPELFTGMLKREAGYHPECGDWEFMLVSGDMKQVLARGKLDSCVECHQQYKQTDYVTRLYPANQELKIK